MDGLMQDRPLLISSLIEHAATFHADTEIVSRLPEGQTRRSTWSELRDHAKQVANAMAELGVTAGDRVGTLAWNSDRHLAMYYGVSGVGAVLHTINPGCSPNRSATSSTTPRTARCSSTPHSLRSSNALPRNWTRWRASS